MTNIPDKKVSKCCEKKHCKKCGSVDYFQEVSDGFWSMCYWNGNCLEWLGTLASSGYGVIQFKGRQWKVHRIAKALSGEFVPHWLVIDHICRNKICVNPAHLRVCTNAENVLAGESFGAKNSKKKLCIRGHPFKKYGVLARARKGNSKFWRVCRLCKRNNKRLHKLNKKKKTYEQR